MHTYLLLAPERVDGGLPSAKVRLVDHVVVDKRRVVNHLRYHRNLSLRRQETAGRRERRGQARKTKKRVQRELWVASIPRSRVYVYIHALAVCATRSYVKRQGEIMLPLRTRLFMAKYAYIGECRVYVLPEYHLSLLTSFFFLSSAFFSE